MGNKAAAAEYDAPPMQTRETRMAHAGWTQNLIAAGRLQEGERVLVVVDESLAGEGSELLAAVAGRGRASRGSSSGRASGRSPRRRSPSSTRPRPPTSRSSSRRSRCPSEGGARFSLLQTVTGHGGRQIFLGFVDGELLRGELSQPGADLEQPARDLLAQLEGAEHDPRPRAAPAPT